MIKEITIVSSIQEVSIIAESGAGSIEVEVVSLVPTNKYYYIR